MNKKPDAAFGCGGGAFSFACSARATSATASGGRRLIIARIGANGSDGLGGALPLFLVTIGQSGEPRWAAQARGSEGSPPRLALEQEDAVRAVAERSGYSPAAVERAFRARYWRQAPHTEVTPERSAVVGLMPEL